MRLIIGLGNPGAKYKFTRHNVGFEVVDRLAERLKIMTWHKKHRALVSFRGLSNVELILAKPLTYMNSSGEAARELSEVYQLPVEEICVVYDDMNLDLGRLRIRKKGSDGGHKGMRSIVEQLNDENVARLRIGVGSPPDGVDPLDYLLSQFSDEERKVINQTEVYAAEALETILLEGIEAAMNKYNSYQPSVIET
jgi:PTH1 family peptidyl-tRNA hydrolase